jgi:subtilisin family serine protease
MESNNLTDDIMKAPADDLMRTELVKATPDSAAPSQRDDGEANASDLSSSVQPKQQQLDNISSISSPNNFKSSSASFQSERELSNTAPAASADALSPPPPISGTPRSEQESATPVPDYLQSEEYVPNQIIIKLKPGISARSINSLQQSMNASVLGTTQTLGIQLLQLNGAVGVEEAIANFARDSRIEYIEPNYRVSINTTPNDPDLNQLWGLNNTGQTGGTPDADIDAPEAWDIQTGSDVVVCVIDTGVDYTHPDLANNIWTNPGEIAGDGIDNDGNGYVDDIHGYDFVNNDADPMDDNSHGTHVAGTIAAEGNNGTGVAGVNWSAQIMPLKFLDAGGWGDTFGAIQAVEYATMMGAKLTSNSWVGGGYSQAPYDAIAAAGDAGQLFVAAAGNWGWDNDTYPEYPASYDLDNIIAVAATDNNDQLAWFSNYGAASVDLGAPGVDIYSTFPGNSYGTLSGTSMATPHVSGVAALLWAQNPDMTATQVKNRILASADPIPALDGKTVSGGRLNAFRSLASSR